MKQGMTRRGTPKFAFGNSTLILCTLLLGFVAESVFAIAGVYKAPVPSAPRPTHFVKPVETRLPNGLSVVVADRPALPLVAVELVLRSGAELDPSDRGGLAIITGSLLTRGTDKHSAPEIADAIESLGGEIYSGAGWDESHAAVVVMSDKAKPALTILADVVLHPVFKQEELDRLKKQYLDRLRVSLQQPGTLASYVATRVLYPAGEYAHPAGGTMESLQAINRAEIINFYQRCYRPENAVLVFVGDIRLEQAREFAQEFFGSWMVKEPARPRPTPAKSAPWKRQDVVIDMPQAGQAAVDIFKPAIKRDSPDYYTGLVANAALGRGLGSRLNRDIRIKRGLSYGASSSLDPRRDAGAFAAGAQTKNESVAEVARLLKAGVQEMAANPVQNDELKSRQAMLSGNYARAMETNFGMLGEISALSVYQLSLATLDRFIPAINAVTAEEVTAFAKKYLSPPGALIITGKAPVFIEALKKDVPDARVIPQEKLDLNRAELVEQK